MLKMFKKKSDKGKKDKKAQASEELLRARNFYQDFFTGEGKLPMGFSDTFFKAERQADGTMRWEQRTPFDDYLDMLISVC